MAESKPYPSIRTKVECGGQCSATTNCDAFYLEGANCYLLSAANLFLYEGEISPEDVYMLDDQSGISKFVYLVS